MLRDYQFKWKADVYAAWNSGARNVMGIAPTGAGKTVMLGDILKELGTPAAVIAHRMELVSQLALALNREKVQHSIIAPTATVRQCVQLQMETHGETYYRPQAAVRVASVQTLVARGSADTRWANSVATVVSDEGHHCLRENSWGKAFSLFPHARGLLPTAHALRADGKGLGRHADGLVDTLVLGPTCRDLINRGYLTDYRLVCLDGAVDLSHVDVGASGEYVQTQLREAVHDSKSIVGDVVQHYLKFAPGKLGITFAVDIRSAKEITDAYRARGVSAELITADTPIPIRAALMRKFRAREILQLVNVDVLGEGVDVPTVEVISMARPTASFQLYSQQFGRALRPATGFESIWDTWGDAERLSAIAVSAKPKAIIIDHVDNYKRLGLPDSPRTYSLDRRKKRPRGGAVEVPLRVCLNEECLQPFEKFLRICPHCGTAVPPPVGRASPEMVEGDLGELDPTVLKKYRGEAARIDGPAHPPQDSEPYVAMAIHKKHAERQRAQITLRDAIQVYAGWHRDLGRDDAEIYRRFFHEFRTDVGTAVTLNTSDAGDLETNVRAYLERNRVIKWQSVPEPPPSQLSFAMSPTAR